ncbi:mediator of RNA polymerase II transcription subunit 15-like isoform X3 [Mytilus galloprovincialis]|uniref:Mediator of RNA polymerase II transcription subunit 15 n=2 Tax=Mytilus galloprovincialis TaxID=29158 RepID=A0A8B6G4A0_MYTGA|nr:mediator of RNA polymerase II transcription subunit 15 [Mytilus galloprovincialis]
MADQNDWRSETFRRKVIQQIDEAVRQSATPMTKSSLEMENHVFMKAKSREEYLALVARLILHVKEINSQRERRAAPGGMPQVGMQDPINALQNLAMQGTPGMGQQAMMTPQQHAQLNVRQQQLFNQQQQIMNRANALAQSQPRPPLQQMGFNQQVQPGMQRQNMNQNAAAGPQQTMQSQNPQSMVHSPAPPMSQIASSPMSMMTPSPVPPSPAARGQGMYGVPSPSSNMNTPAMSHASPAPRSVEEQAYLDKLQKLSRYVEPLRRMIKRLSTDKDEDHKKDISKMKNLLEILTDPSKRLPMATLLKCEQVLEKLELHHSSTRTTPSSTTTVTTVSSHICAPLLEAVTAHIMSPMFNHSLHRTFGPAMTALYGAPIRAPSPPPRKRRKVEESDDEDDIPHILQGEIARLGARFKVNLNPLFNSKSKAVHLICKLDDKNLPSVPPITVTVPENYPDTSPECDSKLPEYETNAFLKSVHQSMSVLLLRMPNRYTFTELLDKWEMSVRKACAASV